MGRLVGMPNPVLMIRTLARLPLSRRCGMTASLQFNGRAGTAIEQLKAPLPLRSIESGAG